MYLMDLYPTFAQLGLQSCLSQVVFVLRKKRPPHRDFPSGDPLLFI